MPGSKGLNPRELAHRWVKDLGTRPDSCFINVIMRKKYALAKITT